MNIDWSKAPDGATHARNCGWEHPDWYKIVDGVLLVHSCGEGWDESGYSDMGEIPNLHIRPSTEWTGTGLPPVGTVCETCARNISTGEWVQVEILAHAKHGKRDALLVCELEGGEHSSMYGVIYLEDRFRPIRTKEQIEAEERKHAIDAMSAATQGAHNWIEAFGKLHDAGYRKQPKEGA